MFARAAIVTSLAASVLSACERGEAPREVCTPNPTGETAVWRDEHGRTVMYRGMNIGTAKYAPGNMPPLDATDYARMAEWGMTSIRLVTFWQALEPSPGTYDEAYVDGLLAHVALAREAGLDVLVDMHQDVYGVGFGFVGFPRWTCDEALYAEFRPASQWFLSYLTDEVSACFDRFWQSSELRAAYARAAAHLARRLATDPAVTAFEIINEPYWGTASTLEFEPELLQPFYVEVAAAVRAVAPHLAIVTEPSVAHNFGIPSELIGPLGCPSWAYAPHYYPLFTSSEYSDQKPVVEEGVAAMAATAAKLGAPLAITEVGMEAERPGAGVFLNDFFAALDAYPASAWVWDYGPDVGFSLVDREHVPKPAAAGVVRPYATRLAGELLEQRWDASSGVYVLRWRSAGGVAPSVIVAPSPLFPDGFELVGEGVTRHEQRGARLEVWASAGEASVTLQRR